MIERTVVSYRAARPHIRDGDLLLYRSRWLSSFVIQRAGRGEHSHAATAAYWRGVLMCLEVREFCGGRAVTLSSQVKRYPGQIDVFRPNPWDFPRYSAAGAVGYMIRLCGQPYGWRDAALCALSHLPIARWFRWYDTDDQVEPQWPSDCSASRSRGDRVGGGVDPVERLADWCTEPADLAHSPFYKYLFTLE